MENVFSLFSKFLHYECATLAILFIPSPLSFWLYSPFAFPTQRKPEEISRGNPMSTSCIKAFENNINFESSQVMIIWEIFPFFSCFRLYLPYFFFLHRKTLFLYKIFSETLYFMRLYLKIPVTLHIFIFPFPRFIFNIFLFKINFPFSLKKKKSKAGWGK